MPLVSIPASWPNVLHPISRPSAWIMQDRSSCTSAPKCSTMFLPTTLKTFPRAGSQVDPFASFLRQSAGVGAAQHSSALDRTKVHGAASTDYFVSTNPAWMLPARAAKKHESNANTYWPSAVHDSGAWDRQVAFGARQTICMYAPYRYSDTHDAENKGVEGAAKIYSMQTVNRERTRLANAVFRDWQKAHLQLLATMHASRTELFSQTRHTLSTPTGHVGNSLKSPVSSNGHGSTASEKTWKSGSGRPLATTSVETVSMIRSNNSKYSLLALWNALRSPIRTCAAKFRLPAAKARLGCSSYLQSQQIRTRTLESELCSLFEVVFNHGTVAKVAI